MLKNIKTVTYKLLYFYTYGIIDSKKKKNEDNKVRILIILSSCVRQYALNLYKTNRKT